MEAELLRQLSAVLAEGDLILDETSRAAYSVDIAGGDAVAAAVARPRDTETLAAVVAAVTGQGYAVVPRGSAHSYTGGTVPERARSVIVDTADLDQVIEVNETDGFVRVGAGCTWARLHEALSERNLRTPFFGPLSGHRATIGGTLSSSAAFFGSAMHGYSDRSVTGLAVVLADGSVLRTGIGGDGGPHPRPSGIDATGMFLGDCGAFGIKAEATLRLLPVPGAVEFASFDFADAGSFLAAQTALTRFGGIGECFGFDPAAHARLVRGGFETLTGPRAVLRQGPDGPDISFEPDRRHAVGALRYSLHASVEGDSAAHALDRLAAICAVAHQHGGVPVPDTIPRVTRTRPFRPIKALLGPDGERWLPLHGVFRLSDVGKAWSAAASVLDRHAGAIDRHGIAATMLTVSIANSMMIEPHLFWRDSLNLFHRRYATDDQRAQYGDRPADEAARAAALALRADLGDALRAAGGEHLQLGRYYPHFDRLDPARQAFLRGLKRTFDPKGLMNPGALLPAAEPVRPHRRQMPNEPEEPDV
jgi:D-lactate dehydrogenase (cytochrome)